MFQPTDSTTVKKYVKPYWITCCLPLLLGALLLSALPSISKAAFAPSLVQKLPLPAPTEEQVLFYRLCPSPMPANNGVALWLKGDSLPGTITLYVMMSRGSAGGPLPVPGTGKDDEALWPAWISQPISTDFSGWRRLLVPFSGFTFRAPLSAPTIMPPTSFAGADTFGIASTKNRGVIYVDGLVWANVDATGAAVGDSSPIDDFHTGDVSAWRIKGPPEAVQGFLPGVTAQLAQTKDAKVSLKLDFSNWYARRGLLSRIAAAAMASSGNDYLVSVPASPFERILPGSLPDVGEIRSRVSLTACAEQTEAGSFALYSKRHLTNVTVQLLTNLNGIGNSIPRSAVNISVVKVWNRHGHAMFADQDDFGPVPELIVKDDRAPVDTVAGNPPDIRLIGAPITEIAANSEKQFWVDVTVPRNTIAGDYTAQMVVKSDEEAPIDVALEVNVLPIRLLSPSKQYVIDFRGKLGDGNGADVLPGDRVTPVQLQAELADISSHGFHYVTLSDSPTDLPTTLATQETYNFQTPFVYPVTSGADGFTTAQSVAKLTNNPEACCYLVPAGPSMAADVERLSAKGLLTAAVIQNDADYSSVANDLDTAIYPVDYAYVQGLLQSGGKRSRLTRDWLAWPASQADCKVDRLYAGYLLWRSNLYGAFVGDYQTCFSADPYDDSSVPVDPQWAAYRPEMLTYPAKSGVIDTVQWESVREGINDVRFLTTFYSAWRECKDAKVDMAVVNQSQIDVVNFLNKNFWLMSDVDYQKGRMMIAKYAVQLRLAVDTYNKR